LIIVTTVVVGGVLSARLTMIWYCKHIIESVLLCIYYYL